MVESDQRLQEQLFLPAAPGQPVIALPCESPELLRRGLRVGCGVRRWRIVRTGIKEEISGTGGKKVNVHGLQWYDWSGAEVQGRGNRELVQLCFLPSSDSVQNARKPSTVATTRG